MTGAFFVMAVSAYYLLRRQDVQFAKASLRLAAVFGLVASVMTVHMGDESGYLVTRDQPTKIAAMEAIWDTHEAPAPMTLFAIPDQEARTNHAQIDFPWLFGIIGTRSLSTEIPGINQLEAQAVERIQNGQKAVVALEKLRKDPKNEALRDEFRAVQQDLGFGLLLKSRTDDIANATPDLDHLQRPSDASLRVVPLFGRSPGLPDRLRRALQRAPRRRTLAHGALRSQGSELARHRSLPL